MKQHAETHLIPNDSAPAVDIRTQASHSFWALREQTKKDFPNGMSLEEINEELRKARAGIPDDTRSKQPGTRSSTEETDITKQAQEALASMQAKAKEVCPLGLSMDEINEIIHEVRCGKDDV